MSENKSAIPTAVWSDRKRYLGMPISFTKYRLTEDRLFHEKGLLTVHEEEVLLYRVRDLELKMTLGQRLFGVGSVVVHSSDKTAPALVLENVKKPREVKEQIYQQVEKCKEARRMKTMEMVGDGDDGCEHDLDGDGIPDSEE